MTDHTPREDHPAHPDRQFLDDLSRLDPEALQAIRDLLAALTRCEGLVQQRRTKQ